MNVTMIPQMILPSKRFPANVTGIRSLIRVGPLVYQQIIALGELSVAEFAYELFLRSLAGQPSCEEGGGRWDRERWMDSTLMMMMMAVMMMVMMIMVSGGRLGATTPDCQQRGIPQPIVEERCLITNAVLSPVRIWWLASKPLSEVLARS